MLLSARREGFLEEVHFDLDLKGWVGFWMVRMKRERHFGERECRERRCRDRKAQGIMGTIDGPAREGRSLC